MSKRTLAFLVSIAAIAIILSACGPGGGGNSGGSTGSAETLNVSGAEFAYTPNKFTVTPGEKVTVNFKNTGTVQHTFVIKDLNFKLVASPGQTVSGSFTAPSKAGDYQIHCDVAGHTEAGMQGTLTVAAEGS